VGLFFSQYDERTGIFMLTGSQGRRRARTVEQREAYNAYQRDYRRRNPDKARQWQRDYIMRKAARLAAEQAAQARGGDLDAGA